MGCSPRQYSRGQNSVLFAYGEASEPIGYNLYEVLLLMFTLVLTNGSRDSYSRMVGKRKVNF